MAWVSFVAAMAAIASPALAVVSANCPLPGLCFTLNVPDATVASAAGDIFVQVTAPITYGSITLAHGRPESRADYFFINPNPQESNVTVSRISVEREQPEMAAGFEVLAGSGIKDGKMTAVVRCSTCDVKHGGSMDVMTSIRYWDWDYRAFDPSVNAPVSGLIAFPSSSGGLSTQNRLDRALARRWPPSGSTSAFHGPPRRTVRIVMTHGVIACLAVAFILPLGGILVRLCSFRRILWVHAGLQVFGLCLYTVAVGLGINLGLGPWHKWLTDKHAVIGLTVYGLLVTQAVSGSIHHLMFKKYISRTTWSYIHLWIGRLSITMAMINAGFGFQLRREGLGSWKVITYTVCAVLMWIAYVSSILIGERRRKKQTKEVNPSLESGTSAEDTSAQVAERTEVPKQG